MRKSRLHVPILVALLFSASPALAQTENEPQSAEALLARIERLEKELDELKASVAESTQNRVASEETSEEFVQRLESVEKLAATGIKGTYSGAPSDAKWHLAGYADVGAVGGDMPGENSFVTGKFNPGFHFQFKDNILFESELEFSTSADGETEIELEYSQFDIILNDYVTLVAGKYLSPIGQFQERLHPSWINKIQGAPAGFGHDGIQPASDTGIQLRGAVPLGTTRLAYSLALGNGPRTTAEGGVALEGMGSDDNGNKSVGGRIGYFPLPYLELGGSYLNARVDGYRDAMSAGVITPFGPQSALYELWGVDAAYTKGPVTARFEYLNSTRGELFSVTDDEPLGTILPEMNMDAWYGQISYRLSGIGDSEKIQKLEPVIRFGQFRISGNDILEEENEQDRLNLGLNYWLSPTIVTKAGLEWRDYKAPGSENETRYQFQIAYGF